MIDPIQKVTEIFQTIEPDDLSVKFLAMIPIICNLFLEVKKNQLQESQEYEKLQRVGEVIKTWRIVQIILIPYIAERLENMTFRQRFCALSCLSIFAVIHESHLESVIDLAQKNR